MTHDLEAALREAREFVRIAAERAALRSVEDEGHEENRIQLILARIDAALSAASGDASGDDLSPAETEMTETLPRSLRPAPSEAPNVERARNLAYSLKSIVPPPQSVINKIEAALDSARAEGIAAMRECAAKIALRHATKRINDALSGAHSSAANEIAAAIREAKP